METSASTGHHARGEVVLRTGPAFVLTWNPPEPGLARDARGVQQQSVLPKEGVSKQLTGFNNLLLPCFV